MKFIIILAVLCFCVQGSLQQCFGQNYYQGNGGCGYIQGGGGCGSNTNPEILITLYKIMFHLTTTTTTTTTTATPTTAAPAK
ncbi:hypothetical protein HA402_015107 [Bradysia odoriphaga]|nr:hypothetical protein HA402_015107 [Bradysia odoriphaga]